MWKKNEDEPIRPAAPAQPTAYAAPSTPRAAEPRRSSGGGAVIGESIRIEGEIRGDEDLLIEGEVDGRVNLEKNSVTIGKSGRVKADVHGRNITVDGKVQGNLFADEQVVVRESGEVRGNITAPRVSLEDGAKFKGAIDMEPKTAKPERSERPGAAARSGGDSSPAATAGGGGSSSASSSGTAGASSSGTSSGSSSETPATAGGGATSGTAARATA
jgi:cytoskeletal protein CcmA (bactofilin family)